MKKLFLLAATALVGFSSDAQEMQPLSISGSGSMKQAVQPYDIGNVRPQAKSSIAGGRWYNHAAMVDEYLTSGLMDFGIFPIWWDSTISQVFNTGLGTINFSAAAQIVDPSNFTLWNDDNVSNPNDIAITPEVAYDIDSVSVFAFYVENPNRPLTIVDTLVFSVSTSGNNVGTPVYILNPSSTPWTNYSYTCTNCIDSTVYGWTVGVVDEANRGTGATGAVTWKVPIDSSMRRPDSSGVVFGAEFTSPVMVMGVPGAVTIPPGRTAAVTVAFKSGDNHNAMDSIDKYNHMWIHSGEGMGTGLAMPYFYYSHRDRNMSNLMFSTATDNFEPAILIEGNNGITFRQEFHNISTHIYCGACSTVAEVSSVHNINNAIATDMFAFPNPASNEVNVSFTMDVNTTAKVYITDAVGKLIATQEVGNVIAKKVNNVTFPTANLATGVYFYTVEAKGQRATNRFVVSH